MAWLVLLHVLLIVAAAAFLVHPSRRSRRALEEGNSRAPSGPSIPSASRGPAMATGDRHDLLPGMLEMLILKALTVQAMHGHGIAEHLRRVSQEVIEVDEGSLHPVLQRMEQKGWIGAESGQAPNDQRARCYSITAAGRRELGAREEGFAELMAGVRRIMRTP